MSYLNYTQMKKLLSLALLLMATTVAKAQDTTGMVAHWKLNGNCLDATGKGHNGIAHNIIPAKGKSGKDSTGFYFNGTDSSYISVAYKPDLNLKKLSICATVKVAGFYSGLCQGNAILSRGKPWTDGSYLLIFTDNAYDGDNCYAMDTTKDAIEEWAGGSGTYPSLDWRYSETVKTDKWYSIVVTYNDTDYNVYINDTLVKSDFVGHMPMDSTGDSLAIGINLYETAAGFPYSYKGTIDDIRIYNRVLDSSEVVTYTTSTVGDTLFNHNGNGNGNDTTGNGGDTTRLAVSNIKAQQNILHLYPNPARNTIYISFSQPEENAKLIIYNELGQEVKTTLLTNRNMELSVSDLTPGMYFIRVVNGNKITNAKFFKE